MGRKATVGMVCLGVMALAAASRAQESRPAPVLRVLVANPAGAPSDVLMGAERDASYIFAKAGVQLAWRDAGRDSGDFDVIVDIVTGTKLAGLSSGRREMTVGYALVDERAAELHGRLVYARYDEITKYARQRQMLPNRLCGLVIAHEIGHLLLPAGHSSSGLMRATWTLQTPLLMYFTSTQASEIRRLVATVGR